MIISCKGKCRIQNTSAQELIADMVVMMGAFVTTCRKIGISDELIEKTLVSLIVDGFDAAEDAEVSGKIKGIKDEDLK